MTKKTAHIVAQQKLKRKVLPSKINNVFNASVVARNSFGKDLSIKSIENNIGFDSGCKRASQYGRWFGFRDTANQSSKESKITGLIKHPAKPLIMEHISI